MFGLLLLVMLIFVVWGKGVFKFIFIFVGVVVGYFVLLFIGIVEFNVVIEVCWFVVFVFIYFEFKW